MSRKEETPAVGSGEGFEGDVRKDADNDTPSPAPANSDSGEPDAIAFLKQFAPKGPWDLAAFPCEGGSAKLKRFFPGHADDAFQWITHWNEREHNIYFHVNPGKADAKSNKTDITEVRYFHVDIDPEPNREWNDERMRLLNLLTENRPAGVPEPTFILNSGNGYWGLWKLRDPLTLDGTAPVAEEIERFNRWLEEQFSADACHDVSRVARLPGCTSYPNAKKRALGREQQPTSFIALPGRAEYTPGQFQKAAPKAQGSVGGDDDYDVELPEELPVITDLEAEVLKPYGLHPRFNSIIQLGYDPEKFDSVEASDRSTTVYYLCCEFIRKNVPHEVTASLLLDKKWAISAHVLDQKSNRQRYVRRQIRQAAKRVREDDAEKKPRKGGREPCSAPIIHEGDPYESAALFLRDRHPHLKHYNDDWLTFKGSHYVDLEEGTVRQDVYSWAAGALTEVTDKNGNVKLVPFRPTKTKVSSIIDSVKARAHVRRDRFEAPCWLEDRSVPADEVVACANGLIHLSKGELLEPTPAFFTRNALEFSYDPNATEMPVFDGFLESIWGRAPELIELLQEVFGYLIVPDTSFQKIFLLVGPSRSGKGTIHHVLTALVGQSNVGAPSMAGLGSDAALEDLIGKQIAFLSDFRIDAKTNLAAASENLLRISGGDVVSFNRKYKRAWTGTLRARFFGMTNEIPSLDDSSGALVNRFVPMPMYESFLGREDTTLTRRMMQELPAILNWSIKGRRRLLTRGHFELPEQSLELQRRMIKAASPICTFIDECCDLDPAADVIKSELFDAWKRFCEAEGRRPGNLSWFARKLFAAFPKLGEGREERAAAAAAGRSRRRLFSGIRLRESAQRNF